MFRCKHKSIQTTPISEFRAPTNSSLQNTARYQFSLKSETINNFSILLAAILKIKMTLNAISSLPINSSLQNNPRYKCSLKSENIEILTIFVGGHFESGGHSLATFLVRIFYQPLWKSLWQFPI